MTSPIPTTSIRSTLRALAPPGLAEERTGPFTDAHFDVLERAYATPPRAYHTIEHVAEVARRFDEVARDGLWTRPREVYLAVLFHDAIYIAQAAENEARSVELMRATLSSAFAETTIGLDHPAELIGMTALHGRLGPRDVSAEAALFLDCDMAILGADPERFDRYEAGIAAEYADAPRELYLAGRKAFLSRLARSPRLFLSDRFHALLHAPARENLRRTIGGM